MYIDLVCNLGGTFTDKVRKSIEDGSITTDDDVFKSMVEPLNDLGMSETKVRLTDFRRTSPVAKEDVANTYYCSCHVPHFAHHIFN